MEHELATAVWVAVGVLAVLILTIWQVGTLIVQQLKRIVYVLKNKPGGNHKGGLVLVPITEPEESTRNRKADVTHISDWKKESPK